MPFSNKYKMNIGVICVQMCYDKIKDFLSDMQWKLCDIYILRTESFYFVFVWVLFRYFLPQSKDMQ